jgi:hypothetical protein
MLTQLLKFQNYYALDKEADAKTCKMKRWQYGGRQSVVLKGKHLILSCCNQIRGGKFITKTTSGALSNYPLGTRQAILLKIYMVSLATISLGTIC